MTGQKMKTAIFIGPNYYQRLKHLVMDKILSIIGGCGFAKIHLKILELTRYSKPSSRQYCRA
jgi:hypothetical protein